MSTGVRATPGPQLRILAELRRGRASLLVLAAVLSLAGALAALAVPLVVRELIVAIQRDEGKVGAVALMAGLALGAALASALSALLLARAGEDMVHGVRTRVVAHVLRLPLQTVRREGTGSVVARATADAAQLRAVVDVGVTELPVAAITVVVGLVIMGLLDPVLLLIAVGSFALSAAVIAAVVVGIRRNTTAQQVAIGQLAQRLTAALTALPVVKAQRAERQVAGDVAASAGAARDAAFSAARLQSVVGPIMELGLQIALIGVVVGSGARLASGALTIPDFAAFLLYLLQLISPFTVVALGVSRLQTGLAARERLDEVLALPAETDTAAAVPPAATPLAAVELDGVTFAHDDDRPVLRDVSFAAPTRGLTAIVGPSGAGKSTVLGLVERFLEPSGGHVRVLGHDVRDWPLGELRRRVAYVDQGFTLLEGTIRDNLLLGRDDDVDDATLLDALEQVGLRDDVEALDDGWNTVIGRATDLSGGQRQRLAVARALLGGADVLVLDEPTSQLDSTNDERLRDVIADVAERRAVIVVAHRIATVQHADLVVVLEGGEVVGLGTHEELLRDSATYRELVRGQVLASGDATEAAL
jgi:ATP-binding cassette subfamily B protein